MFKRSTKAGLMMCLVLGSCTAQPERQAGPAPVLNRRPPPRPAALVPADYVARAASLDLLALRSSELALQRSTSPKVRKFAQAMRLLHEGTSAQLAFAGRRLDLPTRATLRAEDEASLRQLQEADAFDTIYISQQKALHRRAVQLHGDYQARGSSPTLRTVAAFAAGRLREYQRSVDAL